MGEFSLYHLDPWRDCIKRGVGERGVEKKKKKQSSRQRGRKCRRERRRVEANAQKQLCLAKDN